MYTENPIEENTKEAVEFSWPSRQAVRCCALLQLDEIYLREYGNLNGWKSIGITNKPFNVWH